MRKAMIILMAAVTVFGTAAAAAAHMGGYYNQQADDGWFDQMYRWMDQHMGGRFGGMMGYGTGAYCPGMGPGYFQQNNTDEAITQEEATTLLEEAVDGSFTSDVFRMGRWYAVFYEDSVGNTKQARVDIFTGQVYTDFERYMYENTGTGRNYRSAGRMMWG